MRGDVYNLVVLRAAADGSVPPVQVAWQPLTTQANPRTFPLAALDGNSLFVISGLTPTLEYAPSNVWDILTLGCNPGSVSPSFGNISCSPCAGEFWHGLQSPSCCCALLLVGCGYIPMCLQYLVGSKRVVMLVQVGSYASDPGQMTCQPCPKNSWTEQEGATEEAACTACAPGTCAHGSCEMATLTFESHCVCDFGYVGTSCETNLAGILAGSVSGGLRK